MAEFPAMPLFTDAYLADTHPELTLEQHGCYFLLLQTQWRRSDDNLPDDDKWFCRLLGIHGNKWRMLRKTVLERFFRRDSDGNWYQKRLRKERDFLMKMKRNRSESGQKGNNVRWRNNGLADRSAIAPTPTPIERKKNPPVIPPSEGGDKQTDKPSKQSKRGTRLSSDWTPDDACAAFAAEEGMSEGQIAREAERFRDHWIAQGGARGVKANWLATWRNWIRNGIDRGSIQPAGKQNGAANATSFDAARFGGAAWYGRKFRIGNETVIIGDGWKLASINPEDGMIKLVPCDERGKEGRFGVHPKHIHPDCEIH